MSHTNNCIAKSAVASLSKMEEFPDTLEEVSRTTAINAYRKRDRSYTAINNHVWFECDGVAYRVIPKTNRRDAKYHIMSFYNNTSKTGGSK